MARIGILVCSNCTQETSCCMNVCLADLRKRKGYFERYPADTPLDLVGIATCAGCPTVAAPGKILKKVRSIVEAGVDALHLTYCMTALCPFFKSYHLAISETYPDLVIVNGTHRPVDTGEFRRGINELLSPTQVRPQTMTELIRGTLAVPGDPLRLH